jgi:hypothetical protein
MFGGRMQADGMGDGVTSIIGICGIAGQLLLPANMLPSCHCCQYENNHLILTSVTVYVPVRAVQARGRPGRQRQ